MLWRFRSLTFIVKSRRMRWEIVGRTSTVDSLKAPASLSLGKKLCYSLPRSSAPVYIHVLEYPICSFMLWSWMLIRYGFPPLLQQVQLLPTCTWDAARLPWPTPLLIRYSLLIIGIEENNQQRYRCLGKNVKRRHRYCSVNFSSFL